MPGGSLPHAGWKGALAGVIEATLNRMEGIGADRSRIHAAVGPVIARRSYEVDDNFHRRFTQSDPANDRFFTPGRAGHHQFDLEAYVLARLAAAGISRVEASAGHLFDPDRFYSYRRCDHCGEADYGRQISLIALPDEEDRETTSVVAGGFGTRVRFEVRWSRIGLGANSPFKKAHEIHWLLVWMEIRKFAPSSPPSAPENFESPH